MMTVLRTTTLLGAAAQAALAVPGVAALQPGLSHRLAAAAAPTRSDTTLHRTSPEEGIRADRSPDGSGWRIEVRCVLSEGRPVLDIARNVHDRVTAALSTHLATHGVAEPFTVAVTVSGIAARYDAA